MSRMLLGDNVPQYATWIACFSDCCADAWNDGFVTHAHSTHWCLLPVLQELSSRQMKRRPAAISQNIVRLEGDKCYIILPKCLWSLFVGPNALVGILWFQSLYYPAGWNFQIYCKNLMLWPVRAENFSAGQKIVSAFQPAGQKLKNLKFDPCHQCALGYRQYETCVPDQWWDDATSCVLQTVSLGPKT